MSNEKKNFTKNEKAKIALKAISGGNKVLKELASEHNVSEDEILDWASELGIINPEKKVETTPPEEKSFKKDDEVELEVTTEEFSDAIKFGASIDNLNMKRLTFWTIFGTFLVLIMVIGIVKVYDHTISTTQQEASGKSIFYDISELKQNDNEILNSFGVVDPDEGIYRIPIDSAISITVNNVE